MYQCLLQCVNSYPGHANIKNGQPYIGCPFSRGVLVTGVTVASDSRHPSAPRASTDDVVNALVCVSRRNNVNPLSIYRSPVVDPRHHIAAVPPGREQDTRQTRQLDNEDNRGPRHTHEQVKSVHPSTARTAAHSSSKLRLITAPLPPIRYRQIVQDRQDVPCHMRLADPQSTSHFDGSSSLSSTVTDSKRIRLTHTPFTHGRVTVHVRASQPGPTASTAHCDPVAPAIRFRFHAPESRWLVV